MKILKYNNPVEYLKSCNNRMLKHLHVSIRPTGKIFRCCSVQMAVIDTGCVVSAISVRYAKSLGVKIYRSDEFTITGITGERSRVGYALINMSFNSGGKKFTVLNLPVYVIDKMLGTIVIGQSLLEHFDLRLNQGSLVLAQP